MGGYRTVVDFLTGWRLMLEAIMFICFRCNLLPCQCITRCITAIFRHLDQWRYEMGFIFWVRPCRLAVLLLNFVVLLVRCLSHWICFESLMGVGTTGCMLSLIKIIWSMEKQNLALSKKRKHHAACLINFVREDYLCPKTPLPLGLFSSAAYLWRDPTDARPYLLTEGCTNN